MLKNSLFWEIDSPEIDHKSYIFGTIHLYRESHAEIMKRVERIIESVDKVFTESSFEINPDKSLYQLPPNMDLIDLLGIHKYERVKMILKKSLDFDLDHFKEALPLMTNQQITLHVMGLTQYPPIDALIYQSALRHEKEYSGIETLGEQMEILQKIPIEYQSRSLVKMSRNIKGFRKKVSHMIDLYDQQKISLLYKSSKKEMGELRKLLLYDRNIVLANRISNFHKEAKSFFTFGAGHLAGNGGVLALLKRKGLSIKAITHRD